jgi:hypothetical protein
MPSTSPAQHRLMEGVAHDPKFAAKAGIPQKVGRDFARADGDTSFAHGGTVEHKQLAKEARARGAHAFGTGLADGGVVSMGAAPPPTMGVAGAYAPPPTNAPIGNPQSRPTVGKRLYGKR